MAATKSPWEHAKIYTTATDQNVEMLRSTLCRYVWLARWVIDFIAIIILLDKMPRYRRDHRAMRPIYECPENNVSAKSADDCARISTLQSYHFSVVKLFSKYSIQCDHGTYWPKRYTRTDRRTLWHHRAVKIRRQIIADIIGITDILSQIYR